MRSAIGASVSPSGDLKTGGIQASHIQRFCLLCFRTRASSLVHTHFNSLFPGRVEDLCWGPLSSMSVHWVHSRLRHWARSTATATFISIFTQTKQSLFFWDDHKLGGQQWCGWKNSVQALVCCHGRYPGAQGKVVDSLRRPDRGLEGSNSRTKSLCVCAQVWAGRCVHMWAGVCMYMLAEPRGWCQVCSSTALYTIITFAYSKTYFILCKVVFCLHECLCIACTPSACSGQKRALEE